MLGKRAASPLDAFEDDRSTAALEGRQAVAEPLEAPTLDEVTNKVGVSFTGRCKSADYNATDYLLVWLRPVTHDG